MKPQIKFSVLTLFPDFFVSPLKQSILNKAIERKIVSVSIHNIRKYSFDKRGSVDDKPFGGGAGMVLRVDVLVNALEKIKLKIDNPYIILLDPKGKVYNQDTAEKIGKKKNIILVCGHYEGVDERFAQNWADTVLSIGDYILSGGESAALVIIDSITRLKKGVLGNTDSIKTESFMNSKLNKKDVKLLDYPVYTRPENFRGFRVPNILLKGDHQLTKKWRTNQSLSLTKKRRPDLLNIT